MKIKYLSNEFKDDFLSKSESIYNSYYNTYMAVFVHTTDLPIYNSNTYLDKPVNFLSKSKCKAIKKPIIDTELPVAWYRGQHGFFPLYYREFELTDDIKKKLDTRY